MTVSSSNGLPFPPDTILFPLFSVVEQSCDMEFYATTQSTEIIQHLDISGETEITALLKIAPESADAVCNRPFRISVPGSGVFIAALNAAADNGQFIFAHGFE